jgi:hypothetical protein
LSWPISDFVVDGLSWAEIALRVLLPLVEVMDRTDEQSTTTGAKDKVWSEL